MRIEPLLNPVTPADATRWLESLTRVIGMGFHIDTPLCDYVDLEIGSPSFQPQDADRIQTDLDRACNLIESAGGDPYDVALQIIHEIASA